MKTMEELLIAWREETITADELKHLEQMLAERDGRARLFEEFLETSIIVEAIKTAPVSSGAGTNIKPRKTWRHGGLTPVAAAVVLIVTGALFLYWPKSANEEFQLTAGSVLVDRKKNGPIVDNSIIECEGSVPATIQFPDGSNMELAPSSSAVVHRRSVELNSGKATFQVKKTSGVADDFSVITEAGTVATPDATFSVELQSKELNKNGGANVKKAAIVLSVAVLAGSINVTYEGSHYVLAMGQSQAFGDEKQAVPPLPEALKGYKGTVAGTVISVGKDSFVLKLSIPKDGFKDKEVLVLTKNVKDPPVLAANDRVYAVVTQADDHLNATQVTKAKSTRNSDTPKNSDF
jgi:ferric-dicitrate binding protein FerR (iron transport regulator)